ncbi:MAG: hypothetical protein K5871_07765 [Lachnospiraceae bacterium]|nr:hypothetical protein [Lachnospiraceae bacterium]
MFKGLVTDAALHFRECLLLNASLLVSFSAGVAYLRLAGKKADKNVILLFIYGIAACVLLLCPVTSSIMRVIVGTYYDAPDMWLVMPLIPFGAVMCAALAGELLPRLAKEKKAVSVLACVLLASAVLLCGSLGTPREQTTGRPENAGESEHMIAMSLFENGLAGGDGQVILASDDMIAYLHEYSGNVQTLYGRDMWDGRLMKNRYGWYSPELVKLHDDMNKIVSGEYDLAADVCERAFELGATVVILPGECDAQALLDAGFEVQKGTVLFCTCEGL